MGYVTIKSIYIHDTEEALCIEDEDGEDLWIPKSVIEDGNSFDYDSYERGSPIEIEVAEWFAVQEGLE